jgi:hypothetical protein
MTMHGYVEISRPINFKHYKELWSHFNGFDYNNDFVIESCNEEITDDNFMIAGDKTEQNLYSLKYFKTLD